MATELAQEVVLAVSPSTTPPIQLVFDLVRVDVTTSRSKAAVKRILSDVSGTFGPAELIAVMGPSGSGKTTMLGALNGIVPRTSGSIMVNGTPFDKSINKHFTTFVPQDDLLTAVLTPQEALMDAASFKTTLNAVEAQARTEALLAQFGLVECRDVMVGHPEGQKGLSGGQRKRLSVALELMGNPSLLFLDEPTSGLDALSALTLVKLLSSLSKSGATVVATIHQPSAATFFHFDQALLLATGKMCYFGRVSETVVFLRGAGYVCPEFHNPADFMMELLGDASAQAARCSSDRPSQPTARGAKIPCCLLSHSQRPVASHPDQSSYAISEH